MMAEGRGPRISLDHGAIVSTFSRFFADRGYGHSPTVGLLADAGDLLFTNSSMTPFRDAMLHGQRLDPAVQVQPCLRTNDDWLVTFTMLGVLAMADQLIRVTTDLVAFLDDTGLCGLEDLHCVMCAEDVDLRAAWDEATGGRFVSFLAGNTAMLWTHWRYGSGDRLIGRGMTFVREDPERAPCGADCSPICECGRFFPLANVIMATSGDTASYVDVGMGLEGLVAAHEGGDFYASDPYQSIVEATDSWGLASEVSTRLANELIGSRAGVRAGCRPGPRGAGHVLRRLLRSVALTLRAIPGPPPRQRCAFLLEITGTDPDVARVVLDEVSQLPSRIARGTRGASRYLRRHAALPRPELRARIQETYGLPAAEAEALVIEILDSALLG
ncbi:MAG: hypothetical protein COC22_01170 [Flavobacteriaceae bacterium]|nr:MAG: hypothetical protein COC22_01170 [Flavobacteriaceae bacterium]